MARREGSKNGLLLGAGLLVGGYFLYEKVLKPGLLVPVRTAQYVKRLRVNMPAVRFKGDNVEFDVYIQNPNPTPITIDAVVGDVYLQSQSKTYKLGNVDRYGSVVIKPLAETKYTFSIRLKFLQTLAYFTDIVQGRISNQVLTFSGTVTVDKRPWPVKESYRIS